VPTASTTRASAGSGTSADDPTASSFPSARAGRRRRSHRERRQEACSAHGHKPLPARLRGAGLTRVPSGGAPGEKNEHGFGLRTHRARIVAQAGGLGAGSWLLVVVPGAGHPRLTREVGVLPKRIRACRGRGRGIGAKERVLSDEAAILRHVESERPEACPLAQRFPAAGCRGSIARMRTCTASGLRLFIIAILIWPTVS